MNRSPTDWPGGIYISPGLPGTRPGGPIAAACQAVERITGYMPKERIESKLNPHLS